MSRTSTYRLAVVFCLVPGAAHANIGVPMIAVVMPAFAAALIPVILVEAYVFRRAEFPWRWALTWNAIANCVTTLIGVPVTWFVLLGLNLVTVGSSCGESIKSTFDQILWTVIRSPWLCPMGGDPAWPVSLAFLVLLIPFFVMSWLIESMIIRIANRSLDKALINRTCLRANITSYAGLTLYAVVILLIPA